MEEHAIIKAAGPAHGSAPLGGQKTEQVECLHVLRPYVDWLRRHVVERDAERGQLFLIRSALVKRRGDGF